MAAEHKQSHLPCTLFLEPFEQILCGLSQTSEAEAMPQVDTQQPEGLVLRGVMEIFTVLLQPQPDDWG